LPAEMDTNVVFGEESVPSGIRIGSRSFITIDCKGI
jgi:hypothetical protein